MRTGEAVRSGEGRGAEGLVFRGGGRFALAALVVGMAGLGAVAAGALFDRRQALFSYLMAFIFWHSIAFGGLMHLMIQHAIGASWGVVLRRLAEGVAGTFPILALLFLPILVEADLLYPWAAGRVGTREAYLNLPFFTLRAVVYFAVWIGIGWMLERWTLRQDALDRERAAELARRQRALSAVGLPIVAFTITFAAIDWVMALDAEWLSTIFGVYYFAGAAAAFTALLVILAFVLQRSGHLRGRVSRSHYHALGKLLLVFIVFWAYIAFSQFFLIWIADIPREVEWYLIRSNDGWATVSWILIAGHFAIPFLALLSWRLKRRPGALAVVGAWGLAMHLVDIYWLVLPVLHPAEPQLNWLDLAALAGVGGVVGAFGIWRFRGRIVAPAGDPRYEESLGFYTT